MNGDIVLLAHHNVQPIINYLWLHHPPTFPAFLHFIGLDYCSVLGACILLRQFNTNMLSLPCKCVTFQQVDCLIVGGC